MIRNKAYNRFGNCFLFVFVMCLVLFNLVFAGCGLDKFYYVPSPVSVDDKPTIDSNYDKRSFEFNVPAVSSGADFKIVGTDIYYKIYSDKALFDSETGSLKQLEKDQSAGAFDKLIGYKYCILRVNNYNESPLIHAGNSNQNIKLRLTDYLTNIGFDASFSINNNPNKNYYPLRENGKSFNFGRGSNGENIPKLDDSDVGGSKIPADGKWYVSLFAVTRGHEASYVPYHSNIVYLGSVCINSLMKDN